MTKRRYTKSEATRQSILEAALMLFATKGYHGTSMRDIADNAGMALGAAYNYFADKEAIFETLLHERTPLPDVAEAVSAGIPENEQGAIEFMVRYLLSAFEAQQQLLALMMIEILEFNAKHIPALFVHMEPLMQMLVAHINSNGDHLRSQSPIIIFRSMMSLVLGYFITNKMVTRLDPPPENPGTLDDFIDLYLWGIMKRD